MDAKLLRYAIYWKALLEERGRTVLFEGTAADGSQEHVLIVVFGYRRQAEKPLNSMIQTRMLIEKA